MSDLRTAAQTENDLHTVEGADMNDLRNKLLDLIATKQKWLSQWRAPELLTAYDRQSRSDMIQILSDNIAELKDVLADLEKAESKSPEPVPWLRAIDEAMVDHHLGVADPADDYETAKRKLNNLLCHAQDIGAHFAKQGQK